MLHRNCLKPVTEGKIEGRVCDGKAKKKTKQLVDMTLQKREDTGNWKRKH